MFLSLTAYSGSNPVKDYWRRTNRTVVSLPYFNDLWNIGHLSSICHNFSISLLLISINILPYFAPLYSIHSSNHWKSGVSLDIVTQFRLSRFYRGGSRLYTTAEMQPMSPSIMMISNHEKVYVFPSGHVFVYIQWSWFCNHDKK